MAKNINIGRLFSQGRAKTPNELWSEAELAYISEHGSIDMNRVEELRNKSRLEEARAVIAELEKPKRGRKPKLNSESTLPDPNAGELDS